MIWERQYPSKTDQYPTKTKRSPFIRLTKFKIQNPKETSSPNPSKTICTYEATLKLTSPVQKIGPANPGAFLFGQWSLASLSIAWCIHNPFVTTAILGATRKEQLIENLKALNVLEMLKPEVISEIENVMGNKPEQPEY